MILRDYQQEAVDAVYNHLRHRDDNPCVVIPTGGGKTPIMATICKDVVTRWQGRVLILAHVKELLEQAVEKLRAICDSTDIGIFSAGLRQRQTEAPVIVAGIQSAYQRACDLGRFDIILIDEAHMIPPSGEGMYRRFLTDAKTINPLVRLVGLTATPYRMTSGEICAEDHLLNHICYEAGVRDLIKAGYLSRLRSKSSARSSDTSGVHVRGGEFIASELAEAVDREELVSAAVDEIISLTCERRSVIMFCTSVDHAHHVAEAIKQRGHDCATITGETPSAERAEIVDRFKAHEIKYLSNVNVLTHGFDAPGVDCVALLRPTLSPGLYYQMVGRGLRIEDGKEDCLILDYGGNIMRHGPIDMIETASRRQSKGEGKAPVKTCEACRSVVAAGNRICPECGADFPLDDKPEHDMRASGASILSEDVEETVEVDCVEYYVHKKRGAPEGTPRTMRVEYHCGLMSVFKEWVCVEHGGFARGKAVKWWDERSSTTCPTDAEEAVFLASEGALDEPATITIRRKAGEKFPEIVRAEITRRDETTSHETFDVPF